MKRQKTTNGIGMKKFVRKVLFSALLVAGASTIMAPTPGAVGGCGAEGTPSNYTRYCEDLAYLNCQREAFLNDEDYTNEAVFAPCVADQSAQCADRWPAECASDDGRAPNAQMVDLCLAARSEIGRIELEFEELDECRFCGGVQ